jgi:hypothetical protein
MPAPLLVGPALYGAGLISGGLKTAAGVLGVGGTYAALRGAGVNPLGGRAESMAERRGLTPPPARGDRRSDGRFYTGPEHGWQSAPTARKHGLLGSEVLGDAAFPERPAPPRRNVQWQDVMFGNSVPAGANSTGAANPGQWSPTAQQNPRLPAGRNVAIVNPPQRAQNRASEYRCPECRAARLELAGRREQRDVGIGPGTRYCSRGCSGGSRR